MKEKLCRRDISSLGPSWVLWVFFKIIHNPKLQNTCRWESSWVNVSRHNSRIRSPRTSDNRINVVKEKFEKDLKIWERKKLTKKSDKLVKEANRTYRLKHRLGMAEERITELKY